MASSCASAANFGPVRWPDDPVRAEPDLGIEPELVEALSTLSPRDREIVALRFGGDLHGPEIAEMTELSLANVQQILSRSLRQLRTVLEEPARTDQP